MIDDQQLPEIVCDVDVPYDGETVYIPVAWLNDFPPNFDAYGVATFLLSYPRGEVVTGEMLADRWRAEGQPLKTTIRDLIQSGYLVPDEADGTSRYRLVHPVRLGPLPTV